jgi:predicted permease
MFFDPLTRDLRAAVRSLARYPVAAGVAILSLALGIGVTSATLTIRDTIFSNPPPLYQQPEQLSLVNTRAGGPRAVPAGLYRAWADTPNTGQLWATVRSSRRDEVRTGNRTETLSVQAVTPNLFSVLGVQPAVGRAFDLASGGESPSVVLSHRVWQLLFDERREAIGETLWIGDRPYAVIGVMPERFWFLNIDALVWTVLDVSTLSPTDPLPVALVRRPQGIGESVLLESLGPGIAAYAATLPQTDRAIRVAVDDIGGIPLGFAAILPFLFAGCVALTWLICCANVAVLLTAQWTAREHEFAIRTSLGSGRGRLVRTLLTESTVIAAAGGALGLCVMLALSGVIRYNAGPILRMFDTSVHAHVIVESVVLTWITGLLTGLAPALYETRRLQANPLRAVPSERVRQRWRHALVGGEIAATVALLVVAGTLVDAYRRQVSTDLGYSTRGLLVVTVEHPGGVPAEPILASLTSSPDIAAAAAATSAPFGGGTGLAGPRPVALDAGGAGTVTATRSSVSPAFFATLGVPMRAGRTFVDTDRSTRATVAIVNESLANRLFPGQRAIGNHIWLDQAGYEVVGVVADYLSFPLSRPSPAVFLALAADGGGATRLIFVLRAPGAQGPLAATLRRDIPRVGRGTLVAGTTNVDEVLAIGGQEMLAATYPLVPLIAIGIALTAVGIYAVLAFTIERRSKELAVRLALGATARDIVGIVAALTVRLIAGGSVLGLGTTFALSRIVRATGGAGSFLDTPAWPAFVFPALILAAVGALATWIPAQCALRIQPAVLLRVD